jgi:hypothetical protein
MGTAAADCGGAALSLRKTDLEKPQIMETVMRSSWNRMPVASRELLSLDDPPVL